MSEIIKKEICKCENCGNEAEMVFTCSLPDVAEKDNKADKGAAKAPKKVKGTATCTRCGNEADMWIDY